MSFLLRIFSRFTRTLDQRAQAARFTSGMLLAAVVTLVALPADAASNRPAPPAAAASATAAAALPMTSTGLVQMPDGRLLAPEFARIIERGELVVAVLGVDQPPFFEERFGQLTGLDITLAGDIAKKLGVKVRFNRDAKTFDDVVSLLAKGQADLAVSKLSRTLPRAQEIGRASCRERV